MWLERVKKSGDNYILTADFLENSSNIMAWVSAVWLEFWQMTFFFINQLLFWYSFRNVSEVFPKFWLFKTFPYFANTYSSHRYLWELFASRKEYFVTVITPLLLSLVKTLFDLCLSISSLHNPWDAICEDCWQEFH